MTALFVLTVRDTGLSVIVRARCMSCARDKAVEYAGAEGTLVWRDNNLSSVSLVDPQGKPGLIMRSVEVANV